MVWVSEVKKNWNGCKMFSLAANQTCGFSKPSKTVYKSLLSYKIVLIAKRIYFKFGKVKWVTKLHVSRGCRSTLWTPPSGLSEINFFSIDFYALSDGTCCQKQITCNIAKYPFSKWPPWKNAEKCKMGIFVIFTITDKQNLHINVIVENYNDISLYIFTRNLRAQNTRWLPNLAKKLFLLPNQLMCHSYQ